MNRLNQLKKFYKRVSLQKEKDKFLVCLEGKPVKTPGLRPLELSSQKVADLVRLEFEMQRDYIALPTMPMYTISSSFQDTASDPALMANSQRRLLNLVRGDTLQFLDPQIALREKQVEAFGPVHALLNLKYGLRYTFEEQLKTSSNEANVETLKKITKDVNSLELLVLESAANCLKSAGLGLLFCSGDLSTEKAYQLSHMEEDFQRARFGSVEEFHGVDAAEVLMKLRALKVYHKCLSHPDSSSEAGQL